MATSEDVGEQYMDCVDRQDLQGLAALFSPDAVVVCWKGELRGHAEILRFYEEDIFPDGGSRRVETFLSGPQRAAVIISAVKEIGDFVAADLFDLDEEGRVTRLAIYPRGGR